MGRKLITLILVLTLVASLSGCASIFDKEYFNATEYPDADVNSEVSSDGATEVNDYFRLKLEITKLVSAHKETGTLDFRNYDGDIYDDIASACKTVGANTALGAYCVDYISYDIDRIVAYYEADIYVAYKRTEAEMAEIMTISTSAGLEKCVDDALSQLRENLVVMVNASMIGGEEAADYVENVCRKDPLLCVKKPAVTVNVYSGSGLQKMFEFNIDYGGVSHDLLKMRETLSTAVDELVDGMTSDGSVYRALEAASLLISRCTSDEDAGETAYDALIDGAADSEGMAMAFQAICIADGINSQVVVGRLDSEKHYWNVIEVDGKWYHVDVSRAMSDSLAQTFLLNDSAMWAHYWWDTELYPVCDGELSYNLVVDAKQSA